MSLCATNFAPCAPPPHCKQAAQPALFAAHLTVPSSFSSMFLMPLFMRTSPPRAAPAQAGQAAWGFKGAVDQCRLLQAPSQPKQLPFDAQVLLQGRAYPSHSRQWAGTAARAARRPGTPSCCRASPAGHQSSAELQAVSWCCEGLDLPRAAFQRAAGAASAGTSCSTASALQPTPTLSTHLEEAVECDEHADHGQLIRVDEIEGLGHGDEHLVVHAVGHALRAGGWVGKQGLENRRASRPTATPQCSLGHTLLAINAANYRSHQAILSE